MKSNLLFFVGVFAALFISWLGIVIGSNAQLGGLAPYYDDNDGQTHPEWLAGVAAQGQLVYRDLGCVACHTQQVRRPDFGSDKARGWGDRQSVARDYIYQPFPQLGLSRTGPDLMNVGDRKTPYDAEDFMTLLYTGSAGMPSYRFLFERRQIGAGAQPSDNALKLTGALKPPAGWEVVPTRRAEALVGYLTNLKTTYTYPEAVPYVAPKGEGEAAKPSAAAPATAAPAAAKPAAAAPAPAAASAPAATTSAPAAAAPGAAVSPTPAPTAAPGTTTPAPAAAAPAPSAAPAAATPAPSTTPAPATGTAPAATAPAAAVSPTPAPTAPPGTTTPAPAATTPAPSATPGTPAPPAAAQPAAAAAPASPATPAPATTPPAGAPK
jgi:cytochrome c oxidase cbb3-type subunit 2